MKSKYLSACMVFVLMVCSARANLDILVLGSSSSFSDGNESGVIQQKAFSPMNVATQLRSILAGDPAISETVNVVVEDIYTNKTMNTYIGEGAALWSFDFRRYSLAQYYMWPDGKTNRLANLRGDGGTNWDYVVIMEDPYIMANMPGMYAEGVNLISDEVAQGTAQLVLLAQWPENSSSWTATNFNEIVYRAGNSGGLAVVPAGKAWSTLSPQDTSTSHPTPKGAYLAASCIYSKLFKRNAATSSYTYNDSIADHALSVVLANQGVSQYSGIYTNINPFQMKYLTKRYIRFNQTGTSSENWIQPALESAMTRCKVTFTKYAAPGTWPVGIAPIDFNYGRGNDIFEDDKDYNVDPALYDRSYGFPMQDHPASGNATMLSGIDKRYENGYWYEDGTDLGIAYNMIRPGTRELSLPEDVRCIPIRLMFAKMNHLRPGMSAWRDYWHMSYYLDEASGTFTYTLLSGRCPVDPEPTPVDTDAWYRWLGRKTGYETAWRLSHLTTRVPGFQVMPSSTTALTVAPATRGTNTVLFVFPPQSNVTVQVTVDNPKAVIVNPHSLTFTTNNYNQAQTVIFTGLPGATNSDAFNLQYSTSSGDEVYNGLSDSWAYSTVRTVTQATVLSEKGTNSVTCGKNTPLTIHTGLTGMASSNTVFAGPINGSMSWSGTNMVYTPAVAYLGADSFAYAVNYGGTVTRGYVMITVVPSSNEVLTVVSRWGGASPGTTLTNSGSALSFFLTNSPSVNGTTQYVANGGAVVGNEYVQVNPTNITLTLTNSATLTWAWSTNYWLAFVTNGAGSVNGASGWQGAGSNVAITATASNLWTFTGWSGDTGSCSIAGSVITAPMTQARRITASFVSMVPLVVNNSSGAINQGLGSATLQGLQASGGVANAWICWGDNDAGSGSTGAWDKVEAVGAVSQGVVFTAPVAGLATNRTYFYRCFVTNAAAQAWSASASIFNATPVADGLVAINSGGTVTNYTLNGTNYLAHIFTNSGTLTALLSSNVEVLVVAGGGGGGGASGPYGSGGGGGGLIYSNAYPVVAGSNYTIIVGGGGAGNNNGVGANGTNSVFGSLTALGGGGGSSCVTKSGSNGGSGGGAYIGGTAGTGLQPGSASGGYGNNGSVGSTDRGGGGGGAGTTLPNIDGDGGYGLAFSISGSNVYYAGGGNGNWSTTVVPGGGGIVNASGAPNTGGGGGGASAGNPGSGGSGIVMVRYVYGGSVIQNLAPTGITNNAASLNAVLSAASTNYAVTAYWGTIDGGTNSVAWTYSALVGSWTNVASANISHPLTGLAAGTTYCYALRAVNSETNVWAQPSWRFTTPGVASVATSNAYLVGLVPGSGTLNPSFASNVFSYTETVPCSTTSMVVTPIAAEPSATIKVNGSGVPSGSPSAAISLNAGTNLINVVVVSLDQTATNSYELTVDRAAPGFPVVNNSGGATNQGAGSATLQGQLTAGGVADAWICWGDNDGGTGSTSAWDYVQTVGGVLQDAGFTSPVAGLATNKTYFYRCFVTNSAGLAWSVSASSFSGTPAGDSGGSGLVATNSGGTVTNYTLNGTNYMAHIFTNTVGIGTFAVAAGGDVEVLVVAGGGGGGGVYTYGSGGGAGGLIYSNAYPVVTGSNYTVTVGGGGAGNNNGVGANGANSVFGSLTALGGGGGSSCVTKTGSNGGSGGGAYIGGTAGTGLQPGSASGGYGHNGSVGGTDQGGGGGGAGTNLPNSAGDGGYGLAFSISGSNVYYAGGGNGNWSTTVVPGGGGIVNAAGAANTGGGGGGASGGTPGAGGSGIVIVRYVPGGGSVIQNLAPAGISSSNATLNAVLLAPSTNYAVTAYWGTTDGGTNAGAWTNSVLLGSWTNVASTNISYTLTSLPAGTTCYYAFRAVNAEANVWAQPSWQFITPLAGGDFITDFDGDGMPDDYETVNGLSSTNVADALLDADGDGFLNLYEYWAGTSPTNAASVLRITAVATTNDDFRIGFSSNQQLERYCHHERYA